MDEETKKIIKEMEERIDDLEQEVSDLKNEMGSHHHNEAGYPTGNF